MLDDMLWSRLCKYRFVSPQDFRNILPLSKIYEGEYDKFFWGIYPKLIDFNMDENEQKSDTDNDTDTNGFTKL